LIERLKLGFLNPIRKACLNLVNYHDITLVVAIGVITIVVIFLVVFLFREAGEGYIIKGLTKHQRLEFL